MASQGSAKSATKLAVMFPQCAFPAMIIIFMLTIGGAPRANASPWVKIDNELGDGRTLSVSCGSKNRHIGLTKLAPGGGELYFKFHNTLQGRTLWWCHFYEDGTQRTRSFVVWDHSVNSNMPVDCYQCLWVVHDDGFYVWDKYRASFKLYIRWTDTPPSVDV